MAQTPLFANIAELSELNVFTFLSSCFTVVSVPFKVIVPKIKQLTCHSFTGDLYNSPSVETALGMRSGYELVRLLLTMFQTTAASV